MIFIYRALNIELVTTLYIYRKGLKSGTRETITLIAGGNAAGQLLPPHFIFKGKTKMALRSWDTENAPDGSLLSVSPTGWTKQV